MSALADELMADLDGLSDAGDDYNDEELEKPESSSRLKRKATTDPDDVMFNDGEGVTDGETEGTAGMVLEGGVKPAEELDAEEVQRMELSAVDDVRKVARLEGSRRMSEILSVCFFSVYLTLCLTLSAQEIEKYQANPSSGEAMFLPVHSNPEYNVIVQANNLSVDVDNEILVVHKVTIYSFVRRFFHVLTESLLAGCSLSEIITRQSSLNSNGSLLTQTCTSKPFVNWPMMRCVINLSSHSGLVCIYRSSCIKDPTRADLKEIPPAVVMSVLMAATTSVGQKLSDPEWQSVEGACDLADRLEKVRTKVQSLIPCSVNELTWFDTDLHVRQFENECPCAKFVSYHRYNHSGQITRCGGRVERTC